MTQTKASATSKPKTRYDSFYFMRRDNRVTERIDCDFGIPNKIFCFDYKSFFLSFRGPQ